MRCHARNHLLRFRFGRKFCQQYARGRASWAAAPGEGESARTPPDSHRGLKFESMARRALRMAMGWALAGSASKPPPRRTPDAERVTRNHVAGCGKRP